MCICACVCASTGVNKPGAGALSGHQGSHSRQRMSASGAARAHLHSLDSAPFLLRTPHGVRLKPSPDARGTSFNGYTLERGRDEVVRGKEKKEGEKEAEGTAGGRLCRGSQMCSWEDARGCRGDGGVGRGVCRGPSAPLPGGAKPPPSALLGVRWCFPPRPSQWGTLCSHGCWGTCLRNHLPDPL